MKLNHSRCLIQLRKRIFKLVAVEVYLKGTVMTGRYKHQKGPKRDHKRTEKHVITYYLPKRRKNVAEGGKTIDQSAGH